MFHKKNNNSKNSNDGIVSIISDLLSVVSSLNSSLPIDFVLPHKTNILILSVSDMEESSNRDKFLRESFLQYINSIYKHPISLSLFSVHFRSNKNTEFIDPKEKIDCIWFIFNSDKYELKSQAFNQWVSDNYQFLEKTPFYAFSVYHCEMLRPQLPTVVESTELIANQTISISHLWLPINTTSEISYPEQRVIQKKLISTIIINLILRNSNKNFWHNLANLWDQDVANLLDAKILPIKNKALQGINTFDRALLNTKYFVEAHLYAQKATPLIERALNLSSELDKINISLDTISRISHESTDSIKLLRLMGKEYNSHTKVKTVTFASKYQKLRSMSISLLNNLIDGLKPNGLDIYEPHFQNTRTSIKDELHFILFGGFSSGKSYFINTYIKLSEKIKEDVLPVNAMPETPVITLVKHGNIFAMEIDLFENIELYFFSAGQNKEYSSHQDEIKAFLGWYEKGLIDLTRIKIERFQADNDNTSDNYINANDINFLTSIFYKSVDSNSGKYSLNRESLIHNRAIASIDRIMFKKDRLINLIQNQYFYDHFQSSLKDGSYFNYHLMPHPGRIETLANFITNTGNLFQLLKGQPDLCLMVKKVTLKLPLKCLENIAFADTPGTEAMTKQHQRSAINYIFDNNMSPIIYLFPKDSPSKGDKENIKKLVKLRENKLRTFFVINMRESDINNGGDDDEYNYEYGKEIKIFLNQEIKESYRLYVADLSKVQLNGTDQDWNDLMLDLNSHINDDQTAALSTTLQVNVGRQLDDYIETYQKNLVRIEQFEEFRKQEINRYTLFINFAKDICTKFYKFLRLKLNVYSIEVASKFINTNFNSSFSLCTTRKGDLDVWVNTACDRLSSINTSGWEYIGLGKEKANKFSSMQESVKDFKFISADLFDNLTKINNFLHTFIDGELRKINKKIGNLASQTYNENKKTVIMLKKVLENAAIFNHHEIVSLANESNTEWLYMKWLRKQIEKILELISQEKIKAKEILCNEFIGIIDYYHQGLTERQKVWNIEIKRLETTSQEAEKKRIECGLKYLQEQMVEYQSVYQSFINL